MLLLIRFGGYRTYLFAFLLQLTVNVRENETWMHGHILRLTVGTRLLIISHTQEINV